MKTRDMVLISMFAVLTAVGAYITIPIPPVPVTLQYLFCLLSGAIIGSKRGAASQALYVFIGLMGIPVFAGGRGGIGYVLSPTFGYLIGFILCAYIVGKVVEKAGSTNFIKIFLGGLFGLSIIYIIGTAYLYLILNFVTESTIGIMGAIKAGILPFVLKDVIVTGVGAGLARLIVPRLEDAKLLEARG